MLKHRQKWWMLDSVGAGALLCHADGEGGDEGAGGGAGEGGADQGAAKGSTLGDRLKGAAGDGAGDDKGVADKVAHQPGTFDMASLPEDLRGETSDKALEKVYGKLQAYQEKDTARGKVPERAEDYALKLEGDAAKVFPNVENDPVVGVARKYALQRGMGNAEFQDMFGGLLSAMAKEGVIDQPLDLDAEVEKLGEKGAELYQNAEGYLGRMKTKLADMDPTGKAEMTDIIGELELGLGTANGVKLVNWIAGLQRETGVGNPNDMQAGEKWTPETIREARRDPRYATTSPEHNADFRARVDEAAKKVYPG